MRAATEPSRSVSCGASTPTCSRARGTPSIESSRRRPRCRCSCRASREYSKGAVTTPGTRPVYPAVSYWAVFDGTMGDGYDELSTRISIACPFVEVKPIKSQLRRQPDVMVSADCEPLFIALKDHNSRFVIQKIACSLVAMGADSTVTSHPPNAKLVVMSRSRYMRQLPAALIEASNASGLYIVLEVHEESEFEPICV